MNTLGNPTKALEVNMPAAAGEGAPLAVVPKKRAPLPGKLTKEEREARRAEQAKFEARKAQQGEPPEPTAAQGAAGGGGDEERQAQIAQAYAAVQEAIETARENVTAAQARVVEVGHALAERDKRLAQRAPSKSKGPAFHVSPGSGPMMTSADKLHDQKVELERARDQVKAWGEMKVKRAREFYAALKSGEDYASAVAARDAPLE
jgi:hypothetical protein